MKRKGRILLLVLIGVVAYAIFLVAALPAPLAWRWAGREVAPRVQPYGLAGTVWHGQADAVIAGPRRLDSVRWEIRPAGLLTGRLRLRIAGEVPDGRVEGRIALGPGGNFDAEDVKADMDVDTLLAWAGRQGLSAAAGGHFQALFPSLSLRGGLVRSARGVINWTGAEVGFGQSISLGNLALRIQPEGGNGIRGKLVSQGGAFDLSGDGTLSRDGSYRVEAHITPRDPNDPATRQAVRLLDLANPTGTTVLHIQGSLEGGTPRIRQEGT